MRIAMAVSLVATVSLAGCGGRGGTPQDAASPASAAQTPGAPGGGPGAVIGASPGGAVTAPAAKQYDIRGRVEAIPRERVSVTLTHDEIPGVMAAMTNMEYGVADPAVLDGLAAGDQFEGRLEARSGGYVVVSLKKR